MFCEFYKTKILSLGAEADAAHRGYALHIVQSDHEKDMEWLKPNIAEIEQEQHTMEEFHAEFKKKTDSINIKFLCWKLRIQEFFVFTRRKFLYNDDTEFVYQFRCVWHVAGARQQHARRVPSGLPRAIVFERLSRLVASMAQACMPSRPLHAGCRQGGAGGRQGEVRGR